MKFILYFMLISLLFLVGCGEEDIELPVTDEEEAELVQLIEQYKHTFIEAINEKGFNVLEPLLITNHNFYHSVRRYVQDTQAKGIKMQLVSNEIERVYKNDFGEWFVEVKETVATSSARTEEEIVTQQLTYIIVEYNQEKRVMTILVR